MYFAVEKKKKKIKKKKVSVHLADGFKRRLKCEKLTDDRQQTMDAK